eukprot:Partr_v1_DN24144_c0_g1_i3_m70968 putative HIV-1 Tat interactive protein 2, 30kDa
MAMTTSATSATTARRALVMGATGAVGSCLLKDLVSCGSFSQITVIVRKWPTPPPVVSPLLQVMLIPDFDSDIDNHQLAGYSHFFCCHGTTRAKAGSAESFTKIDKDYTLKFARAFKEANADNETPSHYLIVTAQGASAKSWLLYPRTKGEIEQELIDMKFPRLSILRPGLLLERPADGRWMESVAGGVAHVIGFVVPQRVFGVTCEAVAKSMRVCSLSQSAAEGAEAGVEIFENSDIHRLASPTTP